MRTHPVDKLLEQHCYKSAAGLLQLVRFTCVEFVPSLLNMVCESLDLPQVSLEWVLIGYIQLIMRSVFRVYPVYFLISFFSPFQVQN